ncbi:HAD family phosphatase [Candidatus Dependentiae bacterium]|nr:HAD family phosphatase [Candidatus Dependentiae bacterium]MBU4387236.1 HAD family phosphatase [Candidatus Dependentiae bacterium]MCG2755938.1 HAD family phosphatase [Candidatus Dependentiae bacterium]
MKKEKMNKISLFESKIKAVIFDMDGTIIDTEHVWQKVIYDFLAKRGITQLTEDQKVILKNTAGGGLPQAASFFKQSFNFQESLEELIEEKVKMSVEYMQKYPINFINGFENFHNLLKKNHIPTSVGTNASIPTLELLSQKLDFKKFFGSNIYSMEHVGRKAKPDPAVFLHAAEKLNVKPEECLVFEDSISGFSAAKKAGMTLVAIKNDQNKDILYHADFAIDDYTQADEILKKVSKK